MAQSRERLPHEIRDTLRSMNWEAKLEEARRRRAIVLAARSATLRATSDALHEPPEPELFQDEAPILHEESALRVEAAPKDAAVSLEDAVNRAAPAPVEATPSRVIRAEPHASPYRRSPGQLLVERAAPGPVRARPRLRAMRAMGAVRSTTSGLAVAARGLAAGASHRAAGGAVAVRVMAARARTAASRVEPRQAAFAAFGVTLAAVLAYGLSRETPPKLTQSLSVATLPAPAGAETPDTAWEKPAVASVAALDLEPSKEAVVRDDGETGSYVMPATLAEPVRAGTPARLTGPEPSGEPIFATGEPDAEVITPAGEDATAAAAAASAETVGEAPTETADAVSPEAPGATSVRVFVPTAAQAGIEEMARTWVESEGERVDAVREVPFRVSATHVRYYHAADRAVAERLAELSGGDARDFTDASPLPGQGYVELYLAGNGAPERAPPTGAAILAEVEATLTRADQEIVDIIEDIFN